MRESSVQSRKLLNCIGAMYSTITLNILNRRQFFTGVAIVLVILYHYYCAASEVQLLATFKKGYIGVDIFFFFSGLGLGYSYNRNGLLQFYKNRFWRIMPFYCIWAIVHLVVICFQRNMIPTFVDIVGLFTTLSYYGIGSIRSNWYLSALLLLYAAYPVLYALVKKLNWALLLITASLTFAITFKTQLNWYHTVFIGRFYIFLFGIYCYQVITDNNRNLLYTLIAVLIISIFGFASLFDDSHQFDYWGTSCLCPIVIGLLCLVPSKILNSKVVSFCGNHSLECFIGNCWTMLLMTSLNSHETDAVWKSIVYFLSNALFAMVLISANKRIRTLNPNTRKSDCSAIEKLSEDTRSTGRRGA